MKTRLLVIVAILVITSIFVAAYVSNTMQNMEDKKSQEEWMKNRSESMNLLSEQKKCDKIGGMWFDQHCVITETSVGHPPVHFEKIEGYAIDYGGEVKHLPFADVCTDPMKIILLTRSNISSSEEEFVIEDVELPSEMNSEDFERCALETSFTKERSNMVEPYPAKCKSGPSPGEDYYFDEEECEWYHVVDEVPIRCGEPGFNYETGKCNPIAN